jgi:moderate conductance mechanosensitive channel
MRTTVLHLLAQTEGVPPGLCVRDGDSGAQPDLLCELLYRATGSELLARAAGIISIGLRIVVVLVLAYLLTRLARGAVIRFAGTMERRIEARLVRDEARGTLDRERYRVRRFQRLHAITGVARGVVGVLVWLIALLIVIEAIGVSLQPVLAGAGLLGVVLGFGAQQLVRDVLAGIGMLVEDQYGVGDWISVDDRIGQVERVGLRATSFRDMDGVLWHALNGSIERVGNLSQEWGRSTLDVPVALDADVPTVKAIIHKVATELRRDPVWGQDIIGEPEIWGVQEFGPEGLAIRVVTPTKPMANWDINRQLRERLHHAFEQAHVRMPGRLVDVGGMRSSYPVLTRADDGTAGARPQVREPMFRREAPVEGDDGRAVRPKIDLEEVTGDAYEDVRDRTTELRLERGREPRPD